MPRNEKSILECEENVKNLAQVMQFGITLDGERHNQAV